MAIQTKVIPPNVWTNINDISGIPEGDAMQIYNKGSALDLQEGVEPALTDKGLTLSPPDWNYAAATIPANSGIIWGKPLGNYSCTITIQDL